MNTGMMTPAGQPTWSMPFQHGGMPFQNRTMAQNRVGQVMPGGAVSPVAPAQYQNQFWGVGAPPPVQSPTASIAPAPPSTGEIPGQPFAQYGVPRTPWWGYSLPQMGNQDNPFKYGTQPINPVGDVLNPGQAGATPPPAANPGLSKEDVLRMIYNAQQGQMGIDEQSGPLGFAGFLKDYNSVADVKTSMERYLSPRVLGGAR